jgi:hypothetical protein
MFNTIFDTPPFNLISKYITGWTIIIFIIFIIYFIALRKYYLNKETFYYSNLDNTDNIDNIDNIDNNTEELDDNTKEIDNNTEELYDNTKEIDNNTEEIEDNTEEIEDNVVENFENTTAQNTKPSSLNTPATTPQLPIDPILSKAIPDNIINTSLFDNLQLLPEQIMKCKKQYTSVIINYISELTKLLKLIKNNKFLDVDKQVNIILTKGIDNIISFLNNDIKSMNILTRTSIKTDLLNITSNTINYLVDKENRNLTNEINALAKLNSTTIDYNSMVKNIDISRKKIEDYIQIDNLLSKYGQPNSISQTKTNTVLDKSFILPIYERNFDRINQLVNSDFNDNYTKLSDKYGKAYTDYLNQKKKEDLNINPLEMLSKIESGIVNFLTNSSGKSNGNTNNTNTHNTRNNNYNNDLIEQYNDEYGYFNNTDNINSVKSNPLPKQNKNLVNNTTLNKNNIYKDGSNLGNYLINDTTQKDMLEGFAVKKNATKQSSKPITKPVIITTKPNNNNNNNKKKQNEDTSIVAKLFSGDFLEYVMEVMNDKLNIFYTAYYKQFSNTYSYGSGSDTNNTNESGNNFKLDEHLIPAGFLLFILSMLFYFIDVTS